MRSFLWIAKARVAPRSHDSAKRDDQWRPERDSKRVGCAESRMNRPPPHVHGKERVDGSSPSEGFDNSLQICGFFSVLVVLQRRGSRRGRTRSHAAAPGADPLSMKEGRASTGCVRASPSQGGRGGGGCRAALISLSPPRRRIRLDGRLAPVAHLLKDRQAARGSVAPLGAKGWLRVSMCQIASARRRARSIWATLAPRCLPMRAFVCW